MCRRLKSAYTEVIDHLKNVKKRFGNDIAKRIMFNDDETELRSEQKLLEEADYIDDDPNQEVLDESTHYFYKSKLMVDTLPMHLYINKKTFKVAYI